MGTGLHSVHPDADAGTCASHMVCVCVCLPPNKRRRLPWVYAPIHNLVFRSIFLRSAHTVSCPVATLGRIIKERKIQ